MKNFLRLSSWLAALTVAGVFLLPGSYALADTESQTAHNNYSSVHDGSLGEAYDHPYNAQRITVTDRTITAINFYLIRVGNPTGNLYFDIWDDGDNAEIGNIAYSQLLTSDLSTISAAGQVYTVTLNSAVWLNGTYRIGLTSTSQTSGVNYIGFARQTTDVKGSEYFQRWDSSDSRWEGDATWGDAYYSYTYTPGGGAPTIETNIAVGNSVPGEMSLSGVVTLFGGSAVTLTGVQLGTSTGNYTNSQNSSGLSISDNNTGFEETISSLLDGTTYYWRAFAQNSDGTGYGGEETFVMGDVPTLHITRAWMNAGGTDLQATAVIDDDAGSTITSAGVYFDTVSGGTSIHRMPTSVPIEDEEWSVIASSEGVIDTRYYVRAYAVTGAGIAYSEEAMFIAGKSEYSYNASGTGADIILPITTALNNTLESVGMNNGPGKTLAAFIIIAAAWFFFRDKKPLNIIMPVVAFASMFAIGWIEIWLIIVGAALIGVILYFTAGRRASSHA